MTTLGFFSGESYTNLAFLISDQCTAGIKLAAFSNRNKRDFLDRSEVHGSILTQVRDAMEFLGRYNPLRSRITSLRRTDFRAYPDYVLREALTNAVVHRDYSVDSHTLVSVFDDGISIASYGGLKRGLGIDDIMIGMSSPRNPRNASIFYRLGFIEAYGTGIPRMMDDYSDALVKSTIVHSTNVFKVELPEMCPSVSEQSSIDAVLRFAETHEIFTRAEVEDVLKGFRYRAGIILSAMVDEGLLERIGNGRATRYMLSRK